jgi:homoserine kinase
MKQEVTVFAPASVSNVACGFDIMGFALDGAGDRVTARLSDRPGIRITGVSGMSPDLPLDWEKNTAGPPAAAVLKRSGKTCGIDISIDKGLPVGSGIGSSAACAVASAVASNALLEAGLNDSALLECAVEGEFIASGSVHVDNLAPSLFGGFILVRGYNPVDVVNIPVPPSLWCTLVHPHIEIQTKESRGLLPREVPLKTLVTQTGNAAGLIAGLFLHDYRLVGRSLQDAVAEPVRKAMIPAFDAMQRAALTAGALGCSISGSGPSVFALSSSREIADAVGAVMSAELRNVRCGYDVMISIVGARGAHIVGRTP